MRSFSHYRSRTFDRRRFDLRVKVLFHHEGHKRVTYGRTRDLSFSGIGVIVSHQLANGTPCIIVLRFPRTDIEVQLPAVVANGRGFSCGLQFQQLSGEQKLLIQRICKALPA